MVDDAAYAAERSHQIAVQAIPVTLRQAQSFVVRHHRHHAPPRGHKFSLGVMDEDGVLRGVVIVGRPLARRLDDGWTAEATRVCTDGTKNACSFLYGRAARIAKSLGYRKIITYILKSEHGTSLRAAGWKKEADTSGGPWSRPSRRRADRHPTCAKQRWGIDLSQRRRPDR